MGHSAHAGPTHVEVVSTPSAAEGQCNATLVHAKLPPESIAPELDDATPAPPSGESSSVRPPQAAPKPSPRTTAAARRPLVKHMAESTWPGVYPALSAVHGRTGVDDVLWIEARLGAIFEQ
jgi:hypothetical protein